MDFNINVRRKQLENFHQLIEESKTQLHSILNALEWSEEEVRKEDTLLQCVNAKSHYVSVKRYNNHLEQCSISSADYKRNELFLSEPADESVSSIYIDNNQKTEIFRKALSENPGFKTGWNGIDNDPKTSEGLLTTFSSDERLALYDYVISTIEGPAKPPEFLVSQIGDSNKSPTYEEQLGRERDARRRRVKHKSVHTNRKSHVEVMREVIANQMDLYYHHHHQQQQQVSDEFTTEPIEMLEEPQSIIEDTVRPEPPPVHVDNSSKSSRSRRPTRSRSPPRHADVSKSKHSDNNYSKRRECSREQDFSRSRQRDDRSRSKRSDKSRSSSVRKDRSTRERQRSRERHRPMRDSNGAKDRRR